MQDCLQEKHALVYLNMVMNIVGIYGHCVFVHVLGQSFFSGQNLKSHNYNMHKEVWLHTSTEFTK